MDVSVVGVVGAGFMGSGIVESASAAGKRVLLFEPSEAPLEYSRQMLAAALERAVGRERITREDADAQAARVTYTTRFEDLTEAEAVIEAITEDARAKGELFKRLDAGLPDARFLASNTSSIPIAELAAWTERPERVVGLHFFSPVPVMKLVEVVVALETSDETVSAAEEFARAIGKRAIRTKDRSGIHRQHAPGPVPDGGGPHVRGGVRQPRGHR